MKIKVIQDFRCFDGLGNVYQSGESCEVSDRYGDECVKRGLAEEVKPEPEKKPAPKRSKSAKSAKADEEE